MLQISLKYSQIDLKETLTLCVIDGTIWDKGKLTLVIEQWSLVMWLFFTKAYILIKMIGWTLNLFVLFGYQPQVYKSNWAASLSATKHSEIKVQIHVCL